MNSFLTSFTELLHRFEQKTKNLFVAVALMLYIGSLVLLMKKVNPIQELDVFLIKALSNLSIPFGIILLQEFLELITTIGKSRLQATCQQFEIVALVILRSFFKDFGKLNKAVVAGIFSDPAQKALVKIGALLAITILILIFKRLSQRAGIHRHGQTRELVNQWQQLMVVLLSISVFLYMVLIQHSIELMVFIGIVFTGMIVVDGIFFLWSIAKSNEFDSLIFDGGLVVSLIFARFPLFAPNIISYCLAVIGVAFATISLYLFVRPKELDFLGNPQEDDVARLDISISNNKDELPIVSNKSRHFLKQFELPEPDIRKIQLACEELLVNIISYAYTKQDPHNILVSFALCKERLVITVSDSGYPFNPFQIERINVHNSIDEREVGGLGIHLVRNLMNRVSYSRQTGRNVVTLLKILPNTKQQHDTRNIHND